MNLVDHYSFNMEEYVAMKIR